MSILKDQPHTKYPEEWPSLPYAVFKPTIYMTHRLVQMMGKLKLTTPFEPHWSNVALWLTSRGLTTGPIPMQQGIFSVSFDCIEHKLLFSSSSGKTSEFTVEPRSIAALYKIFQKHLQQLGVDIVLNEQPQEIPNAIPFSQDTEEREYNSELVNKWWQILISSYKVLEQYHARFLGISPKIGFMWGTFDLRDARYLNIPVDTSKLSYIERNAMDVHQVEAGFWSGNEIYPNPAYFSFTYPKPEGIETAKIKPEMATWNPTLGEFLLDYETVRTASNPSETLLQFFETTYKAGEKFANWDPKLLASGKPK